MIGWRLFIGIRPCFSREGSPVLPPGGFAIALNSEIGISTFQPPRRHRAQIPINAASNLFGCAIVITHLLTLGKTSLRAPGAHENPIRGPVAIAPATHQSTLVRNSVAFKIGLLWAQSLFGRITGSLSRLNWGVKTLLAPRRNGAVCRREGAAFRQGASGRSLRRRFRRIFATGLDLALGGFGFYRLVSALSRAAVTEVSF